MMPSADTPIHAPNGLKDMILDTSTYDNIPLSAMTGRSGRHLVKRGIFGQRLLNRFKWVDGKRYRLHATKGWRRG